MRGLLRNNIYATLSNAKVFRAVMVLYGAFAAAVGEQTLQICYVMIGIVGFPLCALSTAKTDFSTRWGKYKLTMPVRRGEIVESAFLNQILWLAAGVLFAGVQMGLSYALHGWLFDIPADIFTLFALAVSTSLFMAARFNPLFYRGGADRGEVFLIFSVLGAFAADFFIVSAVNDLLYDKDVNTAVLGAVILVACARTAFGLSFPLTAGIFKKKEY